MTSIYFYISDTIKHCANAAISNEIHTCIHIYTYAYLAITKATNIIVQGANYKCTMVQFLKSSQWKTRQIE